MPPKLNQYVNRAILASIPAFFEDGECRVYTLRAIDSDGLWLESPALTNRLLPSHERTTTTSLVVFVPTAQISALILAAPSPVEEASKTDAKTDAAKIGAQDAATATSTKPKQGGHENRRPEPTRRADTQELSRNAKTKAARKH